MDVRRAASAALTALVLAAAAGQAPLGAGAAERTSAASTDRAAAAAGSSRGNDPYFPFDGNGGYDVRHYLVDVSYVPGEDRLAGATRVRAVAARDLRAFHLDLALTPLRVSVDGRKARFSKPNRHELRVTPQRVLRAGQRFSVTVAYKGRPGSVRATGVSPFMAGREGLAVGQPQIGPWWFAANETPADKARFDLRLRVPAGQQALSNGELLGIDRGPRWTTWRWRMAAPMTTYLAFFTAGRFAVESGTVDGRSFHYGVSRHLSTAQQARARAFLGRTPDVVSWMESQFGSYPFSSLGGVVVSRQLGFALENQTRPVYPYVGGPNDGAFSLLVHELAHQWFGNHVAVKRWRDTWLNEGLATYIEWLYDEAHGGLTVEERLEEEYSVPGGDLFWDLRISDPGPDSMFDSAVYLRGGMMVAALRNRIGRTDHEAFLRAWLQRYGGGNATGTQFRALAEEVSGENLDGFFQAWLDDTRKPQRTTANGLT